MNKVHSTLVGSLILSTLLTVPAWAGGPFEVDYPNLVKPIAQFGTYGTKSGEFNEPSGLFVTEKGDIYVSDCFNKRIQVFDRAGSFQKAFVIPEARCPRGLALHASGRLYVADQSDQLFVLNEEGKVIRSISSRGQGTGQLLQPTNLALHGNKLYIVDEGNNRISIFDVDGRPLQTIGRLGSGPGTFTAPKAITVDDAGNVYVADARHRVQKFTPDGKFVKQWGRYGGMPGDMAEPADLAYAKHTIYVADLVNHRIQAFDTNGAFKLTWGRHPEQMHEGYGRTHYPAFAKVSSNGETVVICEPFEYRCQVFDQNTITNMPRVDVLAWWQKYPKFHYGSGGGMSFFTEVAPIFRRRGLDKPVGDIMFLTEPDIHRVVSFDVNSAKDKLTVRWSAGAYGSGPLRWTMLSARSPVISRESVFIGDYGTHTYQELDIVTGAYKATHFKYGTGPGEFNGPSDIAETANGNLYFADFHNARIQVFDSKLKYKFEFGGLGDGPGKLFNPMGPAFSPSGDKLYVPDTGNRRVSVFDPKGNFLFSFGRANRSGEYGQGTFMHLFNLDVGPDGNVYVTDPAQQLVQKFDANGQFLMQWGGWGTKPGQFYKCKGITVGSDNKVYVVDFGNHRGQIFDAEGNFLAIFGEGVLYPKEMLDQEGKPKPVEEIKTSENKQWVDFCSE
jgi:tripartite motif-containing protein 71